MKHVTSLTVHTYMEVPSSCHVPFANNKYYQATANSYVTEGQITLFQKIHTECYFFMTHLTPFGESGSSVGIATELRTGRSGDRNPAGARFSAPVQTGPGAYPASCTIGTGSFPGVTSSRGVTLTPHPLLVP
jgi:hypothetical protein